MAVQSVPNLIQGVTQQAPQQARDSQCEEQFDCFNSATKGCDARPPFVFVSKVDTPINLQGSQFSAIRRNDEYYLACFRSGGSPVVINLLTGLLSTVTSTGNAYLALGSGDGSSKFRTQVVEDTTFVVNRKVRPSMGTSKSPPIKNQALVFVSAGQYKSLFRIECSGPSSMVVQRRTSDDDYGTASPGYIAQALIDNINAGTATHGYRAVSNDNSSTFLVDREDGADFDIVTSDDNGDTMLMAFKGSAPSLAKLPARGWPGMVLKVKGEDRTKADDFYVKYVGSYSTGVWEETVAPGTPLTFNTSTMPHVLVNTGADQFEFKPASWSSRIAGDDKTAKDPSFIGKYIKDVFWFSGRLGLLTENSVVFSKTRFPYTYFPDTAQAVLATAPIDVSLIPATESSQGASDLDFVNQMDDSLFAWSPNAQFRVHSHNEPLKQDTIDTGMSSAFEYAPSISPVGLKQSVYFASEGDQNTTVRELQYNQGRLVGDTDPSSHIPSYLPHSMLQFAVSDTFRTIFMHNGSNKLWVYNFLDGGQERIQSAWNTWRLPEGGTVLWMGVLGSYLRVLYRMGSEQFILRLDLSSSAVDPFEGADYRTRLDFLTHSSTLQDVVYDEATNTSSFTLPYNVVPEEKMVCVTSHDAPGKPHTRGREFPVVSKVNNVLIVRGDITPYQFYCGVQITSIRKELEFFIRSERGVAPVDRLTVDDVQLEFSHTGYTRMEAHYKTKPNNPSIAVFEGRRLGTPSATTETIQPSNDNMRLSIGGKPSEVEVFIINDTYLPSRWVSLSWSYTAVGRQAEGGRR